MSRDDEIVVMKCKNGLWNVFHIFAQNYDSVDLSTGYYSYPMAILKAHELNMLEGYTEYGVSIHDDY